MCSTGRLEGKAPKKTKKIKKKGQVCVEECLVLQALADGTAEPSWHCFIFTFAFTFTFTLALPHSLSQLLLLPHMGIAAKEKCLKLSRTPALLWKKD